MTKMDREQAIAEVGQLLEGQRDEVISDVRKAISAYISSKKPSECLELVLLDAEGIIAETLPMELSSRYATALIAFVRKAPFEGRTLDSALTIPVGAAVAEAFAGRVQENADLLAKTVVPLIISDRRFVENIAAQLIALKGATLPRVMQQRVIAILMGKLTEVLSKTIDTTTTATIKTSIAKLAAASISSPVAIKITATLLTSLSGALKPIIIKILASTAFKAAIVAKLKAIIIGSMLGAFVKIIGVKLGLTAGATFMWILIPAVLAWLAYEYVHFAEKLADKVSESVAVDMRENFPETCHDLSEALVENIILIGAGSVASHLLGHSDIDQLVMESLKGAR